VSLRPIRRHRNDFLLMIRQWMQARRTLTMTASKGLCGDRGILNWYDTMQRTLKLNIKTTHGEHGNHQKTGIGMSLTKMVMALGEVY
jgi:hypothetical protein